MPEKFSIVNASGNKVCLLSNDDHKQQKPSKKHTCTYPNCGRAFSTSGHLARHHRIHTGEKNFKCLLPQCHSKFSRQDNMMQHFRTHFLAKSKPSKIHIYSEYQVLPPILKTPASTPPQLPALCYPRSSY